MKGSRFLFATKQALVKRVPGEEFETKDVYKRQVHDHMGGGIARAKRTVDYSRQEVF